MKGKILFTEILAIIGTLLIWIPILFPIFLTISRLITRQPFVFDFLMPAELFPLILSGAFLLIWVVFMAKSYRTVVLVIFGIEILSLVGSQMVAVMSGLASAEIEPTGTPWFIVTALIGIYNFSVIALGITGISLIRKLNPQPVSGI